MMKYVSLNETTIKKFVDYHCQNGYVIVSACHAMRNKHKQIIKTIYDKNNKDDKNLRKDIYQDGWSFSQIYGGYVENRGKPTEQKVVEKSYILFNNNRKDNTKTFEDLKNFALQMCNKYEQETVLIAPPNEAPFYMKSDGTIETQFSSNVSVNDVTQDYFSMICRDVKRATGKRNGSFSFTFEDENGNVNSVTMVECAMQLPTTISGRYSRAVYGEELPEYVVVDDN